MQITFAPANPAARLVARVVDQDALPANLDSVLVEGAKASRFTGKAGQVFEGFVGRDGGVVRLALAGIGKTGDADRTAAVEKAGAALTAKYLTSGETELTLDLAGSSLSAGETASLLLAAAVFSNGVGC
mgnify:CR=1 FL=1